jgi:hypothetical protein
MGEDAAKQRPERDKQASAYHIGALQRQGVRESAQAQVLIDRFMVQAMEAGLATQELLARPWSGRGRYRTGVIGWYLRRDGSIGVGTDGGYYVLLVAPVRFGRWRTVPVAPSPPPLQVGRGARDGESIGLDALLQLRLRSSDFA